jgi:hypothetical protein
VSLVTSHIGFRRKIISKYVKRRMVLDDISTLEGNWAITCRAPCCDMIDDGIENSVISFWNYNAYPSSNTRYVIRHRVRASQYEHHTKYWLDTERHEIYFSFCSLNPNIMIGKVFFERLETYYVKRNKVFETSCCRYHIEFNLQY